MVGQQVDHHPLQGGVVFDAGGLPVIDAEKESQLDVTPRNEVPNNQPRRFAPTAWPESLEQAAGITWNAWPPSRGITGRMSWNTHKGLIEEDLHQFFENQTAFVKRMRTKRNEARASLAG